MQYKIPKGDEVIVKGDHSNRCMNPAQKPRKLLSFLVTHFSHPGDWVLDLCSGTGTTMAAALLNGRHCVAVENDETMRKAIIQRIVRLKLEMNKRANEMKGPAEEEKRIE